MKRLKMEEALEVSNALVDPLVLKEKKRVGLTLRQATLNSLRKFAGDRDGADTGALGGGVGGANSNKMSKDDNGAVTNTTIAAANLAMATAALPSLGQDLPSLDAQFARGGRCEPGKQYCRENGLGENGEGDINYGASGSKKNDRTGRTGEQMSGYANPQHFLDNQFLCLNGVHKVYRGSAEEPVHAVRGVTWSFSSAMKSEELSASEKNNALPGPSGANAQQQLTPDERWHLGLDAGSQPAIFGLLGHNGSGKSSLLKMILGGEALSAGQIHVLGLDATKDRDLKKIRRLVGYCPQRNSVLFPDLTVEENLNLFFALKRASKSNNVEEHQRKLQGAGAGSASFVSTSKVTSPLATTSGRFHDDRRAQVDFLLEKLKLEHYRTYFPTELSGGVQRKVMVAVALLDFPQVLMLDEPTTGVDPVGRREMWSFFREFAANVDGNKGASSENKNSTGRILEGSSSFEEGASAGRGDTDIAISGPNADREGTFAAEQKKRFIFLTTHLIDEAELLCSQVAIQSEGRWTHLGTPEYLNMVPEYCVTLRLRPEIASRDLVRGVFDRNLPDVMALTCAQGSSGTRSSFPSIFQSISGPPGASDQQTLPRQNSDVAEELGYEDMLVSTRKTSGMRRANLNAAASITQQPPGQQEPSSSSSGFASSASSSSSNIQPASGAEMSGLPQHVKQGNPDSSKSDCAPIEEPVTLYLHSHPALKYLLRRWKSALFLEKEAEVVAGPLGEPVAPSEYRVCLRREKESASIWSASSETTREKLGTSSTFRLELTEDPASWTTSDNAHPSISSSSSSTRPGERWVRSKFFNRNLNSMLARAAAYGSTSFSSTCKDAAETDFERFLRLAVGARMRHDAVEALQNALREVLEERRKEDMDVSAKKGNENDAQAAENSETIPAATETRSKRARNFVSAMTCAPQIITNSPALSTTSPTDYCLSGTTSLPQNKDHEALLNDIEEELDQGLFRLHIKGLECPAVLFEALERVKAECDFFVAEYSASAHRGLQKAFE
ncbi:unnamed protein product [Amoebophrya sp. A25]|nr:unnamed protein product [Amoebophrya sp. A25]|eukprot:GSA25T00024732001.1